MNREVLKKVADLIELEGRFDLTALAYDNELQADADPTELITSCDTVGCVAGWTLALHGMTVDDCGDAGMGVAAELLGLDEITANRLFFWLDDSVWYKVADQFGWNVIKGIAVSRPENIEPHEAAKVLRQIADGEIEL